VDVLDNDILGAVGHTQTLPTDNTLGSNADQGLVGAHVNTGNTRGVIGHAHGLDASTCVAVCAPRGLVDGVLAAGAGALVGGWPAACFGSGAFGALEVVFLVEHDATRRAVGEPRLQLRNAGWDRASRASASSGASCEAVRLANDGIGSALGKLRTVAKDGSIGSSNGAPERKGRELHIGDGV